MKVPTPPDLHIAELPEHARHGQLAIRGEALDQAAGRARIATVSLSVLQSSSGLEELDHRLAAVACSVCGASSANTSYGR